MFKNINKSSGQASKLLLVLAVVVLVAAIIVYLVIQMVKPVTPPVKPPPQVVPMPVYEQTLDNIRFVFISAIDRGNILKVSDIRNGKDNSSVKDLPISNLGAKFIQVIIGAQNVGKENTDQGNWTIENIVDSEDRNFVPLEGYNINPWLPNPNMCGSLLKPSFDPTPCTKIYEVSKSSSGFKIRVEASKNSGKKDQALIDLIVK